MHKLKKNGKVLTSKFVGTGPSSYIKKKRIYRAAVLQKLRNTDIVLGRHRTATKMRSVLQFSPTFCSIASH